jgi:hypothetical protein
MRLENNSPLTLPSLAGKRKGKNLMAPLTFVLSRRGREKMKGKILKDPSPLPSPAEWRGEKRKGFNSNPHFCSHPDGERRDEERDDFKRHPSP